MCGRAYETYTADELYFQYLNRRALNLQPIRPNYNLCPTQDSLVLRSIQGERRFDLMRWQLIPRWEKTFATKLSTINAKSETVFESRMYRGLVVRQRCVVPLSGFFEWKKDGAAKRPFKIFLQDNSIMSVAGIWDTWKAGTPEQCCSFTILTTEANSFMRGIHDRMPVILDASAGNTDLEEWLDPEIHEQEALQKLMKPCPSDWLACAEVSALVNSTKNNVPEVLVGAVCDRAKILT
jgi:putative SOS response-associated peptidase YedK